VAHAARRGWRNRGVTGHGDRTDGNAVNTAAPRRVDLASALVALRGREVNYDEARAPTPGHRGDWRVDHHRVAICTEPPGAPVPGGPWEIACELVREYEFADPRILHAIYCPDDPLLGRDMLLEVRFHMLRFYLGVRVTEVVDETRDRHRVWGWGYQTLAGHLEQGKLVYEVVKKSDTGEVALVLRAYSRPAPIANPLIRLGFQLFGRRAQLRFYTAVGERLGASVRAILRGAKPPRPARTAQGLVVAPAETKPHPLERLHVDCYHPGA
jgi:uncharacterized protein DUF1990